MLSAVDAIATTVKFNVDHKMLTGELTSRTSIRYLREAGRDNSDFGGISASVWRAGLGEARRRIQTEKKRSSRVAVL